MIGEADYLRKGFGKEIVADLINKITLHSDAKRIVVQPEPENESSCGVVFDSEKGIYIKSLM